MNDTCNECGCADHKWIEPCRTVVACSGRRCVPGWPGAQHFHLCLCRADTEAPR